MRTSRIILFVLGLVILSYFGAKILRSFSVEDSSAELKTDHFRVSFQGIYKGEAQAVADSLESNFNRIRTNLNDPNHEAVRVYIHATQADFNRATGLIKSTANGTSRGPNEFHFIWTNWFNSIFPDDPIKTAIHEFTHCVQLNILIREAQQEITNREQDDFNKLFEEKFLKEYPQWFWEAICDYEAGIVNNISVKYGMGKSLTLQELNNSNQIYNVGYTIIEYIVETWGKDKIPMLITSYVDIEKVLNVSESEFEKGWIEFVSERY